MIKVEEEYVLTQEDTFNNGVFSMAEVIAHETQTGQPAAPSLQLPNADSARDAVKRWVLREIGTAAYPGDAKFLPDSYTWHVPIWLSYAGEVQTGLLADIYLHAATGHFIGRPRREDLAQRAEFLLKFKP